MGKGIELADATFEKFLCFKHSIQLPKMRGKIDLHSKEQVIQHKPVKHVVLASSPGKNNVKHQVMK